MKLSLGNLIRNLFRSSAPQRSARPHRTIGLNVESLEERAVPTASSLVTYHGGPVIQHVQVENVFYGQAWGANQTNKTDITNLNTFSKTIVGSDYMSMLGEYGVGQGSFLGSDAVESSSAPNGGTVTESQIQTMLSQQISAKSVPAENGSVLYVVYVAPNMVSQFDTANGFVGHHRFFTANGTTVWYAVITNPVGQYSSSWATQAGLSGFQGQTEVTTHELSEAVTNPNLSGGWWDSNSSSPNSGQEIGNVVNFQYVTFDGYTVQKEWSNEYAQGIAPTHDSPGSASNPAQIRASSEWNLGVVSNTNGESLILGFDTAGHEFYQWVTSSGQDLGWFSII